MIVNTVLYYELSKRCYGYYFLRLGWLAECFYIFDRFGRLGSQRHVGGRLQVFSSWIATKLHCVGRNNVRW
jgi:hypothetical protein